MVEMIHVPASHWNARRVRVRIIAGKPFLEQVVLEYFGVLLMCTIFNKYSIFIY
jgi:hypothetical protein